MFAQRLSQPKPVVEILSSSGRFTTPNKVEEKTVLFADTNTSSAALAQSPIDVYKREKSAGRRSDLFVNVNVGQENSQVTVSSNAETVTQSQVGKSGSSKKVSTRKQSRDTASEVTSVAESTVSNSKRSSKRKPKTKKADGESSVVDRAEDKLDRASVVSGASRASVIVQPENLPSSTFCGFESPSLCTVS